MIRVTIRRDVDFTELGRRWQDLEVRSHGSFFLSWSWTGCLIEERFPDPVLVEAIEDGRTVALALFNRKRRWGLPVLWLHESGDAELDSPWIEQNGVLTEAGREGELTRLCLGPVLRRWHVVLSGIDEVTNAVVRDLSGPVRVRRVQASPYADLAALRASGRDYLASRSANTRQQIARSMRWYAAEAGTADREPVIEEAATVEAAWAMLDSLAALHQETWNRRGALGSFARPFFFRFHRSIIERNGALPIVSLTKISYDDTLVGYLYNFRFRNRIISYQSGLRYCQGVSAARPGLVAHTAVIAHALQENIDFYDFLAGEDRYKRSLSDAEHHLWWLLGGPTWSPLLWSRRLAGNLTTRGRSVVKQLISLLKNGIPLDLKVRAASLVMKRSDQDDAK